MGSQRWKNKIWLERWHKILFSCFNHFYKYYFV